MLELKSYFGLHFKISITFRNYKNTPGWSLLLGILLILPLDRVGAKALAQIEFAHKKIGVIYMIAALTGLSGECTVNSDGFQPSM